MADALTIEHETCGCCDQKDAKLIPLDVAIKRGLELACPVDDIETVSLTKAMGRVSAQEAVSPLPLPPFDNSAMDGYLINTDDLSGDGPWSLRIRGRIAAGDKGEFTPCPGTTLRILTGAIVPPGFDAVIMQEDTEVHENMLHFSRKPKSGQHIRRRGGDAAKGQIIVPANVELGPRQIGALAAIGAGTVAVRRKIRVAIFSTGNELRQPGEPLEPGQIWNSNRYTLLSLLKKDWIEIVDLGSVPDTPALLAVALEKACSNCDMVITTGGVSVGEEDHMPRLFEQAGGKMAVMKVAIKPGKPITLGSIGNTIVIGLPGNPVSAFVTWLVIGAGILEKRAGLNATLQNRTFVHCASPIKRKPGRCEFRPARFVGKSKAGRLQVDLMDSTFSGRVASLSLADGLAVIPSDVGEIHQDDLLEFIPF